MDISSLTFVERCCIIGLVCPLHIPGTNGWIDRLPRGAFRSCCRVCLLCASIVSSLAIPSPSNAVKTSRATPLIDSAVTTIHDGKHCNAYTGSYNDGNTLFSSSTRTSPGYGDDVTTLPSPSHRVLYLFISSIKVSSYECLHVKYEGLGPLGTVNGGKGYSSSCRLLSSLLFDGLFLIPSRVYLFLPRPDDVVDVFVLPPLPRPRPDPRAPLLPLRPLPLPIARRMYAIGIRGVISP